MTAAPNLQAYLAHYEVRTAARAMLAALKHLEASLGDWDARVFDKARAAIAQAEAAGIKGGDQ